MMDEQLDTMREQPGDGLTTDDIVAASRRKDVRPDTGQAGAESPAQAEPVGAASRGSLSQGAVGRQGRGDMSATPLLPDDATDAFQARWDAIQTGFVDEPRQVVERADSLVAEVMRQLAKTFAEERANLERQWARGGDVSTEDLRLALRRYRSFFQRLLSA
jgi:hypothetical protein